VAAGIVMLYESIYGKLQRHGMHGYPMIKTWERKLCTEVACVSLGPQHGLFLNVVHNRILSL
jgi:hypothetical protein